MLQVLLTKWGRDHFTAGVARALGLTPLDPAAGRFQFQRRQAQGGRALAGAAAGTHDPRHRKATADVAGLESALPIVNARQLVAAGFQQLLLLHASHESLAANLDLRVTSTAHLSNMCGSTWCAPPPDHTCMHTCPRVALLQ